MLDKRGANKLRDAQKTAADDINANDFKTVGRCTRRWRRRSGSGVPEARRH